MKYFTMFKEKIINLTFCAKCRLDMLKQSNTIPYSIRKEDLDHVLGLTLSTPGLFCFLNQPGPGWSWRECLRLLHVARLSKVKVSEKLQVVKKIIMSDSGKWFAVKANNRPTVHVLFVSSDDDVKARK